jgi:23S rRNA pseudouridine1911/1915/1917 synthase
MKKSNKGPRNADMYRVAPSQANQPLATAMRQWFPGKTWGKLRQLIGSRHVLLNGNVCVDSARRLKITDVVRVLEHPAAPPAREDDVRVRHLDAHLVVIEKPSGMTSVRHALERSWPTKRKEQQPTVEDLLPRIIAKKEAGGRGRQPKGRQAQRQARDGRSPTRTPPVRPVHRLDRDTSGVMIFARTVPAERELGQQFRQHTTERRYLAVVEGQVKAQTIESQLVRDRGDGRRGSTEEEGVGKRAVTHLRPLETFDGYTLVECRLETGRTHQIRIQLSEAGHPVCGDKVYGHADGERRSGAPRLALHAESLTFDHPQTGERMTFRMPLPSDLKQFVERLRKKKDEAREKKNA